jgi:guanosine-3',5'-bis(diphosphate) 3'-pyrophosphohydrolase
MQHCAPDIEAMIVGVLHDTVEDTYVTEELLLHEGFSVQIVDAVHLLTRRPEDTYKQFVERLSHNALARYVKIKDLEDNMSKERNPPPLSQESERRLLKYRKAHAFLYSIRTDEAQGPACRHDLRAGG